MLGVIVLLCIALASANPSRVRYYGHKGEKGFLTGRGGSNLTDDGELWFTEQLVDHFDSENKNTWSQRYFVNTTFYQEGGPVFLMIGGEGAESQKAVNGHYHYSNWVEEFHGIAVCLEHRFYGKSFPSDFSDDSLHLLSAAQALNDLATFTQWFKKEYNCENSKWIVVGGSYSGNLSAWARQEYPHLYVGSIASSSPVLAQVDFPEYLAVVQNAMTSECQTAVENTFIEIDSLIETDEGRTQLESLFNVCDGMHIGTSYDDIANFISLVTDPLAGVVQYASADGKDVADMCNALTDKTSGKSDLENYAAYTINTYGGECIDPRYQTWIDALKNTDTSENNLDASSRSWFYQTCIEFGYYQTGTGSIFSDKLGLQYFEDTCKDAYSHEFPNVDHINRRYGAKNTGTTNTFFCNGGVDPWHVLGITELNVDTDTAVLMDQTSHCYDLYLTTDTDPAIVDEVKEQERQEVKKWLGL